MYSLDLIINKSIKKKKPDLCYPYIDIYYLAVSHYVCSYKKLPIFLCPTPEKAQLLQLKPKIPQVTIKEI